MVLTSGQVPYPTPLTHPSARVTASGKFFHRGGEQWLLKGLSYGPFEGPDGLPPLEQVERDLQQLTSLGANTMRIYAPPPRWFLDACALAGVQVLIGWPWPSHTDFLRTRQGARDILETTRAVVRGLRGAPAVLGFVVGNEVPSELVRWMGPARVRRFLERMIDAGRAEAPDALFAYATFPSTEYLHPGNADFLMCNIYLEEPSAFTRYLARLQLMAGDRPLVVGEFGLDTRRHGETRQAEALGWAWQAVLHAGLAGQIVFSFTDEWSNRGRRMDPEWAFGVTDADRRPKEAAVALSRQLPPLRRAGQGVRLRQTPRFSIIICTYNGARTLRAALDSVQSLPYPDYEVILVDDGSSDPQVAAMATEYRDVRFFRVTRGGLSRARNFGARQASGSHLVYLDDDAAAEGDWLTYLALAFADDRVGAAGGPNIPPRPSGWKEAALAAAPGGPAVVMLNDIEAEHVPGCNLAVTRAAWEEVGGFDERHHTAGDDVDFCWRLLEHGYRIVHQPGAMVWHERRRTLRAYFRQQIGYGRAEATLIAQHPHRFGRSGGALWHGIIYEPARHAATARGAVIYAGVFGTAPYQFLYGRPLSATAEMVRRAPWILAGIVLTAGGLWHPVLATAGALMLAPAVWAAGRVAAATRLAVWPRRHRLSAAAARLLVMALAFTQPVARDLVRRLGCLRQRSFPAGSGRLRLSRRLPRRQRGKTVATFALWNDAGKDRCALLAAVLADLEAMRWPVVIGDEWTDWDLEVSRNRWWSVRLVTATEYLSREDRLVRVRLQTRARRATMVIAALSTTVGLLLFALKAVWGAWALAVAFGLWLALENRHAATVTAVRQLVATASTRLGMVAVAEKAPGDDPSDD